MTVIEDVESRWIRYRKDNNNSEILMLNTNSGYQILRSWNYLFFYNFIMTLKKKALPRKVIYSILSFKWKNIKESVRFYDWFKLSWPCFQIYECITKISSLPFCLRARNNWFDWTLKD